MKHIAIAGIHTGIGKTIASAVIARAIGADYWKPVQAGTDGTDSDMLRQLLTESGLVVHEEAYVLQAPMSPHAAAALEGIKLDPAAMAIPATERTLLIETAGGLLSPFSDTTTMADVLAMHGWPAVLVVGNYLGSINHTLLCIEVMKARAIPLLGIIVSGDNNAASESFIEQYTGVPIIARVPLLQHLDHHSIEAAAVQVRTSLTQHLL